jgi:hypothetical protein
MLLSEHSRLKHNGNFISTNVWTWCKKSLLYSHFTLIYIGLIFGSLQPIGCILLVSEGAKIYSYLNI